MLRYLSFEIKTFFFLQFCFEDAPEKSTASAAEAAAVANLDDGSNIWHQFLGGFSSKSFGLNSEIHPQKGDHIQQHLSNCTSWGRGGGLVVSVLDFYSDDLSSILAGC